jgi:hypothetical protein
MTPEPILKILNGFLVLFFGSLSVPEIRITSAPYAEMISQETLDEIRREHPTPFYKIYMMECTRIHDENVAR